MGGDTDGSREDWLEGYCSNPGGRSRRLVLYGRGRAGQQWLDSGYSLQGGTVTFPGRFRDVA